MAGSAGWDEPLLPRVRLRHSETIAYPRLGHQVLRLGRIGLDFFSQSIDEDSQVLNFITIVGTPHGLQQLAMRNSPVAVQHQVTQQVEFLWRKPYGFAGDFRGAGVEIDFEVLRPD